ALGNANLFLLNPAGIVFGPNAQLNIGGSFLGSTANSFIFDNGFEFSATDLQAPPLLTINIPNGLRFRDNPGSITNQSNQSTAVDSSGNPVGLQVPSGNSLVLVGGDINSDGGRLTALGGRVELGGLAGAGTVGLDVTGNTFKLNFSSDSSLSNITLANDARVSVRGNGGGDIAVNTNNFSATNGGRLVAGTEGEGNAGDITVNANNFNISGVGQSGVEAGVFNQTLDGASGNAGNIFINTKSFNGSSGAGVTNNVLTGATGDGGNINITTGSFSLTDGAQLSASTFGQGNAGNVLVQASDSVELAGSNTGILSTVGAGGVGNGGNININAASLSLKDGAQLLTIVRQASDTQPAGKGDAGNVTVDVTGKVTIAGVKDGFSSAIFSSVGTGATGNGGNITISSGSFSLTDGAQLSASTFGQGNAGNVSVRASDSVELVYGDIFSTVGAGGVGKGGNIDIQGASLSLKDGAQVQTSVLRASDTQPAGRGDAGNVTVDVTGNVTMLESRTDFPVGFAASWERGRRVMGEILVFPLAPSP
ncbi:MAG: filamentous hemagglutinin N-terminal domain-containing protein, partial [Scytonema sp. CRU_2_7]|nr:filamentous hemagglutinin N-terminal domain-containing protein [Scytonema sp. CRU_2_7]